MTVQMFQGDGYRLGFSTEGRLDRRIVRFGVHPLGFEKQFKASQQFQQAAVERGIAGILTIPSFSRPNRDFGYALEGFDADLYFLRTTQPALLRGPAMADLLLRALTILLHVRQEYGRTHGGLRPGAVLLALSPDRTTLANLVLTDFAPCEPELCGLFKEPDLVKFEPDDVEAFGEIISQFVAGRLGARPSVEPEVPLGESEPARWLEADYGRWTALARDLDAGKVMNLHALGLRLHALAPPGTPTPEILAQTRMPFQPPGARPSPPRVTLPAGDIRVERGQPVAIEAQVEGTAPLELQWLKNDVPLAGQTGSNLRIGSATESDSGRYTLAVTNAAGKVVSTAVILLVGIRPQLSSEPAQQVVRWGSQVRLAVPVEGTAPLQFQWSKDGQVLSGANRPTLDIPQAREADGGAYVLKVSNPWGEGVGGAITLQVAVPPRITQEPQDLSLRAGDPVELRVEHEGTPPFRYRWRRSGRDLPGQSQRMLRLAAAGVADGGIYDVNIANAAGEVTSREAVLTVAEPPTIRAEPADQVVQMGTSIRLAALAEGTGPFAYQWRKDGVALSGAERASLAIAAATAEDAGDYELIVRNPAGTVTSRKARIRVAIPPRITSEPENLAVRAGAPAECRVEAEGTGPFEYQWFKEDRPLPGQNASNLKFGTVRPADRGAYRVTVRNLVGEATSRTAVLEVVTPPKIVSHPRAPRARAGGHARLSVAVEGTEPLNYQWRKDGVDLIERTAPELELEPLTVEHAGGYDVIVSNPYGWVTSEPATLDVRKPFPWRVVILTSVCLAVLPGGFGWYWRATHEPGAIRFAQGEELLRSGKPGLALQAFKDVPPSSARHRDSQSQVLRLTSLPEISLTQYGDRAAMAPGRLEVKFFDAEAGQTGFSLPFQLKENWGRAWAPKFVGTSGPMRMVIGNNAFHLALASPIVADTDTNTLQFTWDTGAGLLVQRNLTLVLRRLVNEPPDVPIISPSTPRHVGERFTLTARAGDSTLPLGQEPTYQWLVSPTNGVNLVSPGNPSTEVVCRTRGEFTFTVVVRDAGALESSNRLALRISPSQDDQREEELRAISALVEASRLGEVLDRLRTNQLPAEINSNFTSGLTRTDWTSSLRPNPVTLVQGATKQLTVAPIPTNSPEAAILGRVTWMVRATNDPANGIFFEPVTNSFKAGEGSAFVIRATPEARIGPHSYTLNFSHSQTSRPVSLVIRIDQSPETQRREQQAAMERELERAEGLIKERRFKAACDVLTSLDVPAAKARLEELRNAPVLKPDLRQPVEVESGSTPDLVALVRTNLSTKDERNPDTWMITPAALAPWQEGLFTNQFGVADQEGVATTNLILIAFRGTPIAAKGELDASTSELGRATESNQEPKSQEPQPLTREQRLAQQLLGFKICLGMVNPKPDERIPDPAYPDRLAQRLKRPSALHRNINPWQAYQDAYDELDREYKELGGGQYPAEVLEDLIQISNKLDWRR